MSAEKKKIPKGAGLEVFSKTILLKDNDVYPAKMSHGNSSNCKNEQQIQNMHQEKQRHQERQQ